MGSEVNVPIGLRSCFARTMPSRTPLTVSRCDGFAARWIGTCVPFGAVNTPGVVELAVGSRVRDAVAGAGGATGDAVLAGVNLARLVVDGEQILVPDAAAIAEGGAAGAAGNAVPPGPEIPGASPGGALPVDLNTADLGALESLPRVGPALAQRILDWRAANGGFSSVDQLLEVPGIGAKTLEGFRDQVRVS